MRTYISGPISLGGTLSLEEVQANRMRFFAAEDELVRMGHEPVNPVRLHPVTTTWCDAIREDLVALLDCEAIYLLPGWEKSKGARLERHVALELGLSEWCPPGDSNPEPTD